MDIYVISNILLLLRTLQWLSPHIYHFAHMQLYLWDKFPNVELLGQSCCNLSRFCQTVSYVVLSQCALLAAAYEGACFPTACWLRVISLLWICNSDRWQLILQFSFTLHFLLSGVKYLFLCLTATCLLFICELSVHNEKHWRRLRDWRQRKERKKKVR